MVINLGILVLVFGLPFALFLFKAAKSCRDYDAKVGVNLAAFLVTVASLISALFLIYNEYVVDLSNLIYIKSTPNTLDQTYQRISK